MDISRFRCQPWLDETFPLPLDAPFSASTAYAAGITRANLIELAELGLLRHPVRGCYVPAQAPDDTRVRVLCLKAVSPVDAVVVDRHAGWIHGADMVLHPNEHLNALPIAMFLPAGRGRLRNKLTDSGQRTLRDSDVLDIQGLRVTTALRTACDLGRQRWPGSALAALDAMHRLGDFSVPELVNEVHRFRGMRWVTTLRQVAPHTDGRSQSGGESVVRWRWLQLPVPPPEPQVEVRSRGRTAYIDVGNEELRCGVEYDGEQWHTGLAATSHDVRRRSWLRQEAGWMVEPVVKGDVYTAGSRLDELIVNLVAQARRRRAG